MAEIDYAFVAENMATNNRIGAYVGLLACINFELKDADALERLIAYQDMIQTLQSSFVNSLKPKPEAEAFIAKLGEYQPRLTALIGQIEAKSA